MCGSGHPLSYAEFTKAICEHWKDTIQTDEQPKKTPKAGGAEPEAPANPAPWKPKGKGDRGKPSWKKNGGGRGLSNINARIEDYSRCT